MHAPLSCTGYLPILGTRVLQGCVQHVAVTVGTREDDAPRWYLCTVAWSGSGHEAFV